MTSTAKAVVCCVVGAVPPICGAVLAATGNMEASQLKAITGVSCMFAFFIAIMA